MPPNPSSPIPNPPNQPLPALHSHLVRASQEITQPLCPCCPPSYTNLGSSQSASIDSLSVCFEHMYTSDMSSRSSLHDGESSSNASSCQGSNQLFYSFSSDHSSILSVPVLIDEPASITVPCAAGLVSDHTPHYHRGQGHPSLPLLPQK